MAAKARKRGGTRNLRTDSKSGMWNVVWREGDRLRTKSTGTRDLREAGRFRDEWMARIDAERVGIVEKAVPRSTITWEMVENCYRADTDAWPTNEKTRRRYEIDLARIGAFLAEDDILPAEVTLRTVKDFVAYCRTTEELTTSSVKHALTVFNCAMGAAAFDE